MQGFHGMRAKMAHLGSHIGHLEPIHQSEDPSIEGSQRFRCPSPADLARIFPEGDISTSMQPIFNPPMGLLQGEKRWLSSWADWSAHRRSPRALCPRLSPVVVSERLVPPLPIPSQTTHSSGCYSTVRGLPADRALCAHF